MAAIILLMHFQVTGAFREVVKMVELQRIQFWMTPTMIKRVNDLKDRTEAQSNSVVMKKALTVYDSVLREVEAGNALLTRNIDGVIQPFWVFL